MFPYSGKKKYFSCSITLCNERNINKCKAYRRMNFSLSNGVIIIFMVILSFEVALVNSPIL